MESSQTRESPFASTTNLQTYSRHAIATMSPESIMKLEGKGSIVIRRMPAMTSKHVRSHASPDSREHSTHGKHTQCSYALPSSASYRRLYV